MNRTTVDSLIECQADLMRAIDSRDVDAIEEATRRLANAVECAPANSHVSERPKLEHALKQSNALTIRVNTLTDWTRQRIDRLAELRGVTRSQTYSRFGKTARF